MLEKNKDYIEMRVHSTDCGFVQNGANMSIDGYTEGPYWFLPDPGKPYVLISKEKFEALQTENEQLKKKLEECEKDYRLKVDKSYLLEQEIKIYTKALKDWKEITGCPSPYAAKTAIESGASWCHAYNEAKKANEKLNDDVKSWMNATGYSSPEGFLSAMLNDPDNADTVLWKNATGCNSPEVANCRINALINEATAWGNKYNHLLELTGYKSEDAIHAVLVLSSKNCQYDATMRDLINSLKRKVKFSEANWQNATKCETPEAAATWITSYESACERGNNLAMKVEEWKKATGCKTPDEAKSAIRYYRARLGNSVQSASIAMKMLGNSVRSEASAMKVLETISYTDPIKED